jgi:hypothetical protein
MISINYALCVAKLHQVYVVYLPFFLFLVIEDKNYLGSHQVQLVVKCIKVHKNKIQDSDCTYSRKAFKIPSTKVCTTT